MSQFYSSFFHLVFPLASKEEGSYIRSNDKETDLKVLLVVSFFSCIIITLGAGMYLDVGSQGFGRRKSATGKAKKKQLLQNTRHAVQKPFY